MCECDQCEEIRTESGAGSEGEHCDDIEVAGMYPVRARRWKPVHQTGEMEEPVLVP